MLAAARRASFPDYEITATLDTIAGWHGSSEDTAKRKMKRAEVLGMVRKVEKIQTRGYPTWRRALAKGCSKGVQQRGADLPPVVTTQDTTGNELHASAPQESKDFPTRSGEQDHLRRVAGSIKPRRDVRSEATDVGTTEGSNAMSRERAQGHAPTCTNPQTCRGVACWEHYTQPSVWDKR